jgi:hypothetical protein
MPTPTPRPKRPKAAPTATGSVVKSLKPAAPAKPLRGKKSWREKLADDKDLPKVVTLEGANVQRFGGATLAIPAPREVDALMRKVPHGKLATTDELRVAVARKHKAEAGCPITTGIFAWMAAHAAAEAATEGQEDITPYWRILKTKGELNPKYPGGIGALTTRLRAEGHTVFQKGKRFFVQDYARALAKL